jgi:prevent-host-death family protein
MKISVSGAKKKLLDLLDLVLIGGRVIITRVGKPVAKLIRIRRDSPRGRRFLLGSAKGEFAVPDDFNDPLHFNDPLPKEVEDLFW